MYDTNPNEPAVRTTARHRHVARRGRTVVASVSAGAFLALGGVMALAARGTPATAATTGGNDTAATPSTQFVDPFAPLDDHGGFGSWGASPDPVAPGNASGAAHTSTHGS
jgi:hypothetical protein